jgi:hypothetical protein
MAEPLTIVATVLGMIGTGIGVASVLWPRTPAARETTLPQHGPMSQPSLVDAKIEALAVRVESNETRLDGLEARERAALQEAARITERIRALRGSGGRKGDDGDGRAST